MTVDTTQLLDLRGLRCPMPLLKLKQAMHHQRQQLLWRVLTTDPGAKRDIPAFLRQSQHELLKMTESAECCEFLIQAKSASSS